MSPNPYTPPTARVADPPDAPPTLARPTQVKLAVALLLVSLVLGLPMWFSAVTIEEEFNWVVAWIGISVFMYAAYGVLIAMIYRGHNWARFAWLVLLGLGVVGWLWPWEGYESAWDWEQALALIALLIEFTAVALLFTRPGAGWFVRRE